MSTISLTVRIILIVLTILLALVIGLFLRRRLVRYLSNTVLDAWIVQALGILVVFPSLILAIIAIPVIYDWNITTLSGWWESIKGTITIHDITNFSVSFVETLLFITIGIGVARTAQNLTIRGLSERHIDINMRTLIGRVFYILIVTFTVFWILDVWHIAVALPIATIGIITVALTVAIQDILKDLVAGFYILIERPFYIGDQISTATYTGRVEDVQIRATKLQLVSGEEVTIPNSLVFGGIVVNNFYYGQRRATITVTVLQEEFIKDETPGQILNVFTEIESIAPKPEPTVMFTHYSNNQVTLTVRFWVANKQLSTVSDVMYALHTILPNAELTVQESAGSV